MKPAAAENHSTFLSATRHCATGIQALSGMLFLTLSAFANSLPEAKASSQQQAHESFEKHQTIPICPANQPPAPPRFKYLEEAVTAAANRYNPVSIAEDREYMGAVLRHKYRPADFTYTVTAGKAGEDEISISIVMPADYEIVAFWHTHGAKHWSRRYFSDMDTALANHWHLPFYLADFTGVLKVFEPGSRLLPRTQARQLGLGANRGYATGRRVVATDSGEIIRVATIADEDTISGAATMSEVATMPDMERRQPETVDCSHKPELIARSTKADTTDDRLL